MINALIIAWIMDAEATAATEQVVVAPTVTVAARGVVLVTVAALVS